LRRHLRRDVRAFLSRAHWASNVDAFTPSVLVASGLEMEVVGDASKHRWMIGAALVVAAMLRIWAAVSDHSIFWPDEIYQSIEPAHRLAFGNGLEAWEFRDGARSWLFPAVLAGVLRLGAFVGMHSGLALVVFVRIFMVALSLLGLLAAVR